MTWHLFVLLLQAARATAWISLAAIAIGCCIALAICSARLSHHRLLRAAARLYISFFRGVPLLVQLMLIYYLLPALGIEVSSLTAAILALSLCTSAYQAENLRGGFLAVPRSLIEAADIVGMTPLQRFRRIEAPITLRLMLPAMINEAIAILHASALISVVGVIEVTKMARDLSSSTFRPLPIYASAGLLYLAMTAILAGTGLLAERRFQVRAA